MGSNGAVSSGRLCAVPTHARSPGRFGAPTGRRTVGVGITVGFRNAAPLLDSWPLGTAVGTPQPGTVSWP